MARVLLTGFEPFDGARLNPSWQAVQAAARSPLPGVGPLAAVRLSCRFGTAIEELEAAVESHRPELVVCVGQAGGRASVSLERTAVNVDDARIPDNAGRQPVDEPVVPGGPVGYFSTLPVKACAAAVRAAGLPACVSQTAGTFVCNHVFYGLAHLIATERPEIRGGFVHVPYAPDQVADRGGSGDAPSMSVSDMAKALRIIVATAMATRADIRVAEGATH
ncbi:pyroglutamyl-peptidase I [Streptomyces sp. TP-A0874]|uniref:pyroglutamyl-peptidase I n=1 Tax=Streptomyces sp. TP-A0874 TaxID=549819 RepID=UPI0008532873|nr:pyroglutamyl-peptidase I [Streptomyces sp. TP-A0874]